VSIVGYTNAGKSTLLNALAGSQVLVEDKLFATLDPTTKQVTLPDGKVVLFTDTVGFIQKLPTELVASFRATLEEVEAADLLIHVVDASDPNMLQKVTAVEQVLREIGAGAKPVVLALNKVDLIDPDELLTHTDERFYPGPSPLVLLREHYPAPLLISAAQGVGLSDLLDAVSVALSADMVAVDTVVPYASGEVLNLWHLHGIIDGQAYDGSGIHVTGRLPRWLAGRLGLIAEDSETEDEDLLIDETDWSVPTND